MQTIDYLKLRAEMKRAEANRAVAEARLAEIEYDVFNMYGESIQAVMKGNVKLRDLH